MGHGGDCALGAQVSMGRGRQRTDHAVAAPRLGASAAAQAGHNEPCGLIVVCHFSTIELLYKGKGRQKNLPLHLCLFLFLKWLIEEATPT